MRERETTYEDSFLGNTILQYSKQHIGLDENILMPILQRYDETLEKHCRVFAFRFDVHLPKNVEDSDNKHFSRFQAHFIKKEKRAGYDPAYVAVREKSDEDGVHYHEVVLVDGNSTSNIFYHIENANDALNSEFGYAPGSKSGLINDCTKDKNGQPQENGVLIERDPSKRKDAESRSFRHASYLGKVAQKDPSKGTRELFASRLTKLSPVERIMREDVEP